MSRYLGDINYRNELGETQLFIACVWARRDAYEDTITDLMRAGADPNIPNNDGYTPLHATIEMRVDGRDILPIVRLLLRNPRTNPDTKDYIHGNSPIHSLVSRSMSNNEEICKLLLEHGVDKNESRNNAGKNTLDLAVSYGGHGFPRIVHMIASFRAAVHPMRPSMREP
jgi:hypothetical protein